MFEHIVFAQKTDVIQIVIFKPNHRVLIFDNFWKCVLIPPINQGSCEIALTSAVKDNEIIASTVLNTQVIFAVLKSKWIRFVTNEKA